MSRPESKLPIWELLKSREPAEQNPGKLSDSYKIFSYNIVIAIEEVYADGPDVDFTKSVVLNFPDEESAERAFRMAQWAAQPKGEFPCQATR